MENQKRYVSRLRPVEMYSSGLWFLFLNTKRKQNFVQHILLTTAKFVSVD